ncbi:MAG TPA: DNA repair protein RecN [Mycobacteriales bacterium]|jgi:DNA repair protein RecN (Recombination protein N)|nr:DNA repair protein RecN [Mycobacteriales bacterium]
MLDEIRITGLGVIDDAVLELHPGFTVVTGETGAGKTMVVQGLGLLFGARFDSGLIRRGAARAAVEGRLRVEPDGVAATRARDAGADIEDGELLVSRTMTPEGRSRCHVGGRSVPVALVAELASSLVALHGQHDQQTLLRPAEQRQALDRFAGAALQQPLADYRTAYARWRAVTAQLEELTDTRRERAREADLLRFGIAEIEAVAPTAGEDAALAADLQRLGNADALSTGARDAHSALVSDPTAGTEVDATTLVAAARRSLEAVSDHDPVLGELARRLAEASYLLADVAADLASYAESVDADPRRLAAAQDRQAALGQLTRKYAADLDGVIAWAADAARRLQELDSDDDQVEALAAERTRLLGELTTLANAVSTGRQQAADRFGAAVSGELVDLAMPHAAVSAAVSQDDVTAGGLTVAGRSVAFGPDGVDSVELLLAPHSGAPARPLHRGASGGELSRVMLAVEVVFAAADPVPTMVFDEVDAGVGGRAAVEIGRRLAQLARSHQVIVVTHLPQVAAFADRHLVVRKSDGGTVTSSDVTTLDDDGRVGELSRMLAGLEESDLARGHAEELLAAAAAAKGTS